MLYHEAGSILGPGPHPAPAAPGAGGGGAAAVAAGAAPGCPAALRSQLLNEALEHAATATRLAPDSLSCAALRAAIVINLLIEESAALGSPSVLALPAAAAAAMAAPLAHGEPSLVLKRAAPGSNPAPVVSSAAASLLPALQPSTQQQQAAADGRCDHLRATFADTLAACSAALAVPKPQLMEPVITLVSDTHSSWDPCCLAVKEKLHAYIKDSAWEALAAEKRAALVALQGVLHSSHALLDSSQVPAEGVVRLLQHLLR